MVVEEFVVEEWQDGAQLYVGPTDEEEVILQTTEVEVGDNQEEEDKSVAAYYDITETEENMSTGKPVEDNSKLKCPHCEKTFELRNSLTNHIRSHSDVRQFACQGCGSKFKKEGDYQRHSGLCGKEHQFKCDVCGKTFMNLNSLSNHVRVHNTEKPFQCTNCSTAFKKQGDMKNHEVRISFKINLIDFL